MMYKVFLVMNVGLIWVGVIWGLVDLIKKGE